MTAHVNYFVFGLESTTLNWDELMGHLNDTLIRHDLLTVQFGELAPCIKVEFYDADSPEISNNYKLRQHSIPVDADFLLFLHELSKDFDNISLPPPINDNIQDFGQIRTIRGQKYIEDGVRTVHTLFIMKIENPLPEAHDTIAFEVITYYPKNIHEQHFDHQTVHIEDENQRVFTAHALPKGTDPFLIRNFDDYNAIIKRHVSQLPMMQCIDEVGPVQNYQVVFSLLFFRSLIYRVIDASKAQYAYFLKR